MRRVEFTAVERPDVGVTDDECASGNLQHSVDFCQ
jgi:hypothetical protein